MGRVLEQSRIGEGPLPNGSDESQTGFTLVEMVVTLAITGIFIVMVSGLLQGTTNMAEKQQALTEGRSAARFALGLISGDLAGIGGRLPLIPPFSADGTLNGVTDANTADLGTDTFSAIRARSGFRTRILALTGDMSTGTMRLMYHQEDEGGDNPICPTADDCANAFIADFGGLGDHLLVGDDPNFWIVEITATPTATLGAGGGINVTFAAITDNTGGASFLEGDTMTGIVVNTYRVMNGTLQMKTDFIDGDEDYITVAESIEDMQLAWVLSDGSYVNDGLPGDLQSIRGTVVSLVSIGPNDMSVGAAMFTRPGVEDHVEGAVADRRRRAVARQLTWSRNLG